MASINKFVQSFVPTTAVGKTLSVCSAAVLSAPVQLAQAFGFIIRHSTIHFLDGKVSAESKAAFASAVIRKVTQYTTPIRVVAALILMGTVYTCKARIDSSLSLEDALRSKLGEGSMLPPRLRLDVVPEDFSFGSTSCASGSFEMYDLNPNKIRIDTTSAESPELVLPYVYKRPDGKAQVYEFAVKLSALLAKFTRTQSSERIEGAIFLRIQNSDDANHNRSLSIERAIQTESQKLAKTSIVEHLQAWFHEHKNESRLRIVEILGSIYFGSTSDVMSDRLNLKQVAKLVKVSEELKPSVELEFSVSCNQSARDTEAAEEKAWEGAFYFEKRFELDGSVYCNIFLSPKENEKELKYRSFRITNTRDSYEFKNVSIAEINPDEAPIFEAAQNALIEQKLALSEVFASVNKVIKEI
jgi:uncharacterized protein YkuJ